MFSLEKLDYVCDRLFVESQIINFIQKPFVKINAILANLPLAENIGSWLKLMGVLFTSLLFICIALPNFANDKQGLAVILLIAFIMWFSGKILTKKNKSDQRTNIVDVLVLIFFCVNIISTFSSHYFMASIHGLLKLFIYILAYFLFCSQLKEKSKHQFIFVAILLIGGALTSIYGLYQYKIGVAPLATWEDPNIENQATRIYATFNNPNLFAGYLLPITMISASLVFANWSLGKWWLSIVSLLLTSLLTLALILTGSRGAYIGAGAGYMCLIVIALVKIWHLKTKRRFILPTILLLAPITIFAILHFMPNFEHRIISIFAGREHSSNSFRLNVWMSSLNMFKDNWLIGTGVGNQAFCLAYGLYMRTGFDALGTYCVPLEIAVESGIFGLTVFALIITTVLYKAHLAFWYVTNNVNRAAIYTKWLTAGAAIAVIALLAHGLVDTVFFRPQIQFIFFLLISILVVNGSKTNTSDIV